LNISSLEYLIKALVSRSNKVSTIEETLSSMFCVDLLSEIIVLNNDRVLLVWKYLFEHIKILLSSLFTKNKLKQEQYIILERLTINILKLSNLFYEKEDMQESLNQLIEIMGTIPGKKNKIKKKK
jgi:hypothetical protein